MHNTSATQGSKYHNPFTAKANTHHHTDAHIIHKTGKSRVSTYIHKYSHMQEHTQQRIHSHLQAPVLFCCAKTVLESVASRSCTTSVALRRQARRNPLSPCTCTHKHTLDMHLCKHKTSAHTHQRALHAHSTESPLRMHYMRAVAWLSHRRKKKNARSHTYTNEHAYTYTHIHTHTRIHTYTHQ